AVLRDGRNLLAFSPDRYDVMISQPAEPWINGATDLYTREFFALAASRLNEGGIFCQWIQLYAIDADSVAILLNTFQQTFKDTFVFHPHGAGEILLVGYKDRLDEHGQRVTAKIDVAKLADCFRQPDIARALHYQGLYRAEDILSMLLLTPENVERFCQKILSRRTASRLNTDSNLLTEYWLPWQVFSGGSSIETNVAELRKFSSDFADCLANFGKQPADRAALLTDVALSLLRYHQKFPYELLDEQALAFAYEAWKLSGDPAMRAACDAISYRAGRLNQPDSAIVYDGKEASWQLSFWTAEKLIARGKVKEALEPLLNAAKAMPQRADLWTRLGQVYVDERQNEKAYKAFGAAISADADYVPALTGMSDALFRAGEWQEAADFARKALTVTANEYRARFLLAKSLIELGKTDEANWQMQWAQKAAPYDRTPTLFIAGHQALSGKFALAESNLQQLMKHAPGDKRAFLVACVVLSGQGKADEAKKAIQSYGDKSLFEASPDLIKERLREVLINL
ncbi:MAG TPA: hypothetical protein V6D17_24060, partial [Candidatus Obscuribacterales bacterium]